MCACAYLFKYFGRSATITGPTAEQGCRQLRCSRSQADSACLKLLFLLLHVRRSSCHLYHPTFPPRRSFQRLSCPVARLALPLIPPCRPPYPTNPSPPIPVLSCTFHTLSLQPRLAPWLKCFNKSRDVLKPLLKFFATKVDLHFS